MSEKEQQFFKPEVAPKIEKVPEVKEEKVEPMTFKKAEERGRLEGGEEKIEEVKEALKKLAEKERPSKEKPPASKHPTEIVTIDDKQYTVEYVPKDEIYPAFGYSRGDIAKVREDLSPRIKNFVRAHELHHCQDKATWGGWLGREIRANLIPGLRDPIGLFATVWATISNVDRMKFYWERIKGGGRSS